MTRETFGQLMTPVHRRLFFKQYNELPEQFTKIFAVEDMVQKMETTQRMGGFGYWGENTEGAPINEDEMHEGPTISYEAKRYDKGYNLTWELIQDDLYNVFKGKGKGGTAQNLGTGLRATIERSAAEVLNQSFTTIGYDGLPLIADAHPLTDTLLTNDNKGTGAFSDTAVKELITLLRKTVSDAGTPVMIQPKQLIVPVELDFTANALMYSAGLIGTASNDKNTIPLMELVVMNYLTSPTAFWVKDATTRNLVFKWREKPWFDSMDIAKTPDKFFYGYARWTRGYDDVAGIAGSEGL